MALLPAAPTITLQPAPPVTFTIAQLTPSVTVADAGGTYNGSAFNATATVNGLDSVEGVSPSFAYFAGSTPGVSVAGVPTTAGTYTVIAFFAGSTDYSAANSTPVTFTIAQATPTVTVMDVSGTFNGPALPATATVNGQDSLEGVSPTFSYYAGSDTTGTLLSGAGLSRNLHRGGPVCRQHGLQLRQQHTGYLHDRPGADYNARSDRPGSGGGQ